MYLSTAELEHLRRLLMVFFALPYSTDLDGKDVEKLLRIVKGAKGPVSKRKELFDIVEDDVGYSVKTLFKRPAADVVDLQEQRFCDKADLEIVRQVKYKNAGDSAHAQGAVLLGYMRKRIREHMESRGVKTAKSAILLKYWNTGRTVFSMRYWEEDFLGYVEELCTKNSAGEMQWVEKAAGLHGQDMDGNRLLRMHYKHNQIFTDHVIPADANRIEFRAEVRDWEDLYDFLYKVISDAETSNREA